jgi:hypothetical protein
MTTKLSCHKLSEAHITECEIASLAKKDTTEILNKKLQAMQHTRTFCIITNWLSNFKTK